MLGTFEEFIRVVRQAGGESGEPAEAILREGREGALDLCIVYFSRTHNGPLGARRRFYLRCRDHEALRVVPEVPHTHQLAKWPQRRVAKQWHLQAFR